MTLLVSLLDHVGWADALARAAITGLAEGSAERAQATRLYAHVAAAEHVWLARLEGRSPAHPVWPTLSLEEAGALAAESLAGLRAVAAGMAASSGADATAPMVTYRNSAGQVFTDRVEDVLAHVALHGSHHRGQIAMLTRQGGATPAATDYIVFVRGVPAPPAPVAAPERAPTNAG